MLVGVGRERFAGDPLDHLEKSIGDIGQMGGGKPHVVFDPGIRFDRFEFGIEFLVRYSKCHLAEQLDEPAVGIVAEALVAGLADQPLQGFGIEAQVENGIHHAGHRHRRTGSHRNQQRVVATTEGLSSLRLNGGHVQPGLFDDTLGKVVIRVLQAAQTGFCRNHEARRDIQADAGHFTQVGPFAAQ